MAKRTVNRNVELESDPVAIHGTEQKSDEPLNETAVAELAYRLWVENGCPQGSADNDWYEAEKELRSGTAAMRASG